MPLSRIPAWAPPPETKVLVGDGRHAKVKLDPFVVVNAGVAAGKVMVGAKPKFVGLSSPLQLEVCRCCQ